MRVDMRTTAILIGSVLLGSLLAMGCDEPEACLGGCDQEPGSQATLTSEQAYPDCRGGFFGEFYEGGEGCGPVTHGLGTPTACDACECGATCASAAECPLPSTGGATPICEEQHCVLGCDADRPCPDDQDCVSGRCHWLTLDAFACAVEVEGPDPCEGLVDETSCRATVSSAGAHECAWVERRTIVSADSCTAASSGFECVHARQTGDGCSDPTACGNEGPRIYWSDEGGGTVDLLMFPCGLEPVTTFANRLPQQACDLSGAAPVPLACGCGCE